MPTTRHPTGNGPLLTTLIRRAHLVIRQAIHAELQRAGYTDLTPAHMYVFQIPGPDGLRPSELAARTNMTKQAMNHLLTALERGGYVERLPAEGDGRAKVLHVTAKGDEVAHIMQEQSRVLERAWARKIGRPQLEVLRATLTDLDELLESELSPAPELERRTR